MPFHRAGAYDGFDTIEEAKEHYRRCRRNKSFILSDSAQAKMTSCCCVCKKPLNEFPADTSEGYRGNRCEYIAKLKKVVLRHYVCAWNDLLKRAMTLADML